MLKKRRLFLLYVLITSVILAYIGRLFVLQLTGREEWIAASVRQRESGLVLDDGRGRFVDRHGHTITAEPIRTIAIFPNRKLEETDEEDYGRLADATGIPASEWRTIIAEAEQPQLARVTESGTPIALTEEEAAQTAALGLPGVSVVPYQPRYRDDAPAAHLIGFTAEDPDRLARLYPDEVQAGLLPVDTKIGASGLELTFERLIRGHEPTAMSLFTDGMDRPLAGLGTRLLLPSNPFYPLNVIATIDLELQRLAEAAVREAGVDEGAVVMLDADSGDVLAMASIPGYDPARGPLSMEAWTNLALEANAPGSVFKLVVAAAALEYGVVDLHELFFCDGSWDKYDFHCWKLDGHGQLTLREAFEQSCNLVFAELMMRLTPEQLSATAAKLGLLQPNGWSGMIEGEMLSQFDREDAGQLFAESTPQDDEGVRIQTAIGQRDVRMTPLQAANLVVTLLHQGEASSVRAVQALRYRTGGLRASFERYRLDTGGKLSAETTRTLLAWMQGVVSQGTARSLADAAWPIAGKTGTAESGDVRAGSEHHWFAGFTPADAPRYALAVMIHDVPPGSGHRALEVTERLVNKLADMEE